MNARSVIKIILLVVAGTVGAASRGHAQASPMQIFDDMARTSQLYGKSDSTLSFCIRPNYSFSSEDALFKPAGQSLTDSGRLPKALRNFVLLPVVWQQQYNTHHAYGWNDGSMIPAKGYETQFSFGVAYKKGIFSAQLRPEIVYAYNPYYSTFPFKQIDNVWYSYFETYVNVIDAPERFGYGRYFKFFPGQSNVKINYKKLSLGASTENLWWGPGIRNSLLMTNTAPGFPHVTFNTNKPVTSIVGSFEWQVVSGILKSSNIIPDDTSRRFINNTLMYRPKPFENRYFNGAVVTWQPKWTPGLFLGFSRVFYQHVSDMKHNFDGYLPIIGKLFKKNLPSEDALKRDQLLSIFFRLVMPKEKAEVYGEFGRNDHAYNLTDFVLQPEHSRAYILGMSKTFDGKKKDVQLFAEITNLGLPATSLIRGEESWYVHYQVREGYTNMGQILGAGIGPGANSQTIGLNWLSGFDRTGIMLERVIHNNDFYYNAFGPLGEWRRNWADLSLTASKSWRTKRIVYDAQVSCIHSLNYEWYYPHVTNFSFRLGTCYLF